MVIFLIFYWTIYFFTEFATQSRRKEHMNIHTGERPYTCVYCGDNFKKRSTCYAHEIRHKIKSVEIVKEALKKRYPAKLPKPEDIQCKTCGKTFSSKQSLQVHMEIHIGRKPFLCTVCGKNFLRKYHLEVHQRIHTGEKPFKCEECGKQFSQPSSYKNHSFIHNGQRPFKCKICGNTFVQVGHLKGHMKIHSGEKPYKCRFCDKAFAHSWNLKAHVKVHICEK